VGLPGGLNLGYGTFPMCLGTQSETHISPHSLCWTYLAGGGSGTRCNASSSISPTWTKVCGCNL
jgi:hypothetical protein